MLVDVELRICFLELNGWNENDLKYFFEVVMYVSNWCDIDYGKNIDYNKVMEVVMDVGERY